MKQIRIALIVLPLAVMTGAIAHAAPAMTDCKDREKAREFARQGRTDYNLGRFTAAEKGFSEAYALCPLPDLLFNLGQVHRALGNAVQARHFYVLFLELAPRSDPNRATAEEFALKMNELARQQQKAAQEQPRGTTDPDAPQRAVESEQDRQRAARLRNAALGTGAGAVALLATGVGLSVAALEAGNEISNPPPMTQYDPELAARGRALDSASIPMYVIGGVAGVTSIVLGVMSVRRSSTARRFATFNPSRFRVEMTF